MASIPSNGYAEVMAGTNNYSGSNSYDGSCPRTAIPPVIGDDLCNKTYVDTATGGGILTTLTDKGSLITADGTAPVIFDQNPYQTALTTTTVYDWNSLAIGQSRQFTTTAPTLIPLGAGITITYSGTDSIKGNITAVAGTTITLTITALAHIPYATTFLIQTSAPDTSVVAGSVFDGQTFPLNPATTTPTPPQLPAYSMITDGECNVFNAGVPANFFFRLLGTGVQRGDSSTQALATAAPAGVANPTPITWNGANGGCFFNSASPQTPTPLLKLIGVSPPLGANFQYPIGGGFVPPNYAGYFSGYTLTYGSGSIVIDDDICLIADPLSSTGIAWGVINTASIGAVTSVSGGVNIVMSGTVPAPIVNLRDPLTSQLNMGSQSLRDSAGAVGTSGQVLSCGIGGQTLWTTPAAANPTITDNNTNATFYPTFVAGSGIQPLLADIATSQISLNPSNGNFNVVDTIKITQSELAIGKTAGVTTQASNAIAIGSGAGATNQGANAVAVGVSAGATTQGANAIAIGNSAGVASQTAGSICLNATGSALNPSTAGLYIDPIRSGTINNFVGYNTTSKELFYDGGAGNFSVISLFANSTARDVALPSPYLGQFCFLTNTNDFQYYNAGWNNLVPSLVIPTVTGFTLGTNYEIIYVSFSNSVIVSPVQSGFTIVRFYPTTTTSGTINLSKTSSITYLTVAGGGGGGGSVNVVSNGGGGGAGGYLSSTDTMTGGVSYSLQVGGGGAGGVAGATGGNGTNSTLAVVSGTITAIGGGGGGGTTVGNSGGSGGGGTTTNLAGGTGTGGQGNNGGTGVSGGGSGGGGGGGASAVGTNGVSGGTGGAGTVNTITGASITYAGGGGGGTSAAAAPAGGAGGGGSGGFNGGGGSQNGQPATDGLGGGGGAGGFPLGVSYDGGKGGAGVVIVRFPSYI